MADVSPSGREIEAAARAYLGQRWDTMTAARRAQECERMRAAFDRVRDARGDDEVVGQIVRFLRDDSVPTPPEWLRAADAIEAEFARSPQGEVVETVLGPLKVLPECKAQAVCVNGLKCWEAGRCLRSPQSEDHEAGIEAAMEAVLAIRGEYDAADAPIARAAVDAYLSRVSPSSERDTEKLVEALRPFVEAYDAVGRTFCPEFNGREALAHFERAAEVLAEFHDTPENG